MSKNLTLILLLIAAMLLGACGGAAAPSLAPRDYGAPGAPPAPSVGDAVQFEEAYKGGAVEAEPGVITDFAPESPQTQLGERLVIRDAHLTMVVPDPAVSVTEIGRMASEMGGFVVYSNVYQATFRDGEITANQASITIRVPAERLDEALTRIKGLASEVRNENISGQDVTEEYTDLQSRLRSQQAAEAKLLEIMGSATKTDDALNTLDRLTRVQQEIEVLKGRIQYLEQSARLSAISVELIPDVAAQPLQIGRWQPQGTVKAAVEALIAALQWLAEAGIYAVICVLPVALILGLPTWLVVRSIRRRRAAARGQSAIEKN